MCHMASDYVLSMKKLLASILGLTLISAISGPARAADNVVLVELFTSQGCSSCPPADENLGQLAQMDGVLGLSLHVDYWDYLGWRDTFAHRKHTERQFAYRDLMGARVVYTPQMIVHGVRDVPGYRPEMVKEAVAEIAASVRPASIQIGDYNGMLKAQITAESVEHASTIWIAMFTTAATVDIARGENAGREITYHNVVDELMHVGPWRKGEIQEISLPVPETGGGTAIWLQENATGRILAASYVKG